MKVRVTEYHIKRGIPGQCAWCPIAMAMRDSGWPDAVVAGDTWTPSLRYGFEAAWRPLPAEVTQWIHDFDNSRPVEPFEFEARP